MTKAPLQDYFVKQIRADLEAKKGAELAQVAANLCPHHINRTRGRCATCDRAETSEEIA